MYIQNQVEVNTAYEFVVVVVSGNREYGTGLLILSGLGARPNKSSKGPMILLSLNLRIVSGQVQHRQYYWPH